MVGILKVNGKDRPCIYLEEGVIRMMGFSDGQQVFICMLSVKTAVISQRIPTGAKLWDEAVVVGENVEVIGAACLLSRFLQKKNEFVMTENGVTHYRFDYYMSEDIIIPLG